MKKYVLVNESGEYLTDKLGKDGKHITTKDINEASTNDKPFISGIPFDANKQIFVEAENKDVSNDL